MFEPIEDKILVEQNKLSPKNDTGIFTATEDVENKGVVIAVGPGKDGIPMELTAGDKILFADKAGIKIKLDGVEYLSMRQSEVYAIL